MYCYFVNMRQNDSNTTNIYDRIPRKNATRGKVVFMTLLNISDGTFCENIFIIDVIQGPKYPSARQ